MKQGVLHLAGAKRKTGWRKRKSDPRHDRFHVRFSPSANPHQNPIVTKGQSNNGKTIREREHPHREFVQLQG